MTGRLNLGARAGAAALLSLVLLLLALAATPALGQEEVPAAPPELLMIDATDEPFVVLRTATEPSQVTITLGGVPAETSSPLALKETSLQVQTVIVIDNSAESWDLIDHFKTIASEYVQRAPSSERIEVWTTGGDSRVRAGFGSPEARTLGVIDSIVTAAGSNHLWDAVRGSSLEFEEPLPGATNIIILTGNVDDGSTNSAALARGAALSSGAGVFMVHAGQTISSAESRLVSVSAGGAYTLESDTAMLAGHGPLLSDAIQSTWAIPFSGEGVEDATSIRVDVDGHTSNGSYSFGSVTTGQALAPVAAPQPTTLPGLGFLEGDTGRVVGMALGGLAAALGAYSVVSLFSKDESGLDAILQAYSDPSGAQVEVVETEKRSFAKNLFVKRAVEITEGIAQRQGSLQRAEAMLERADMPLRAGEAITAYIGIIFASLAVGVLLIGGPIGLLIAGAFGLLTPPAIVNFLAARRKKAFVTQLPDTLQLLASTLKAGYSFMQGVEAVSHEVEDPMGSELRRIVTEAQLGRPLEEAMDASALRMDSEDFAWAVMAVKIQREVGGNLSELLMTVADTMTARERLRRDVAALTAEGKMSAIVLGVLPIGLGFVMWVMNKEYIDTLFTNSLGKILLGTSVVAALIGFAWMKKIIEIEI